MAAPLLEDYIRIDATSAQVWALVGDPRRLPEWSPQVTSTRLRAGFETVALGAEFTNRNHDGELEWITHSEIVRLEPEREIAFRIAENRLVWSFRLSADGDGTVLTQRREAPEGLSGLSLDFVERHLGGVDVFTATMRAGMRRTLEGIKADAEG